LIGQAQQLEESPPAEASSPIEGAPSCSSQKSRFASAWLSALFFVATRAPWLLKLIRPIIAPLTVRCSATIAPSVRCNAQRIFGSPLSLTEQRNFTTKVVGNFYDFVVDLARSGNQSVEQILARVDSVKGESEYRQAREKRLGAILVTAHMGAFEVGLASLRRVEPNVHVVFKRDEFPAFEKLRSQVRKLLDVREAPIDEGLPALLRLRDALKSNEVVVMQGDRAMPGQRARAVPFFNGHLRLPLGPIILAQITGSPIIPVFVVRTGPEKFRIHLGREIHVNPDAPLIDRIEPALIELAQSLQSQISLHPDQWLVLDRAFIEDEVRAR
jgi:phosphatidylinositol dimannoside acyltransferase